MTDTIVHRFAEHAVAMSVDALCAAWINNMSAEERDSFAPEELERYSNLHAYDYLDNKSENDRLNYFIEQAYKLAPVKKSLIAFDYFRNKHKKEFEESVSNAWNVYQKKFIQMIMPLDGGFERGKN